MKTKPRVQLAFMAAIPFFRIDDGCPDKWSRLTKFSAVNDS